MEYNSAQEKLIYTLLICFIMEFVMAYYNYFFHTDAFLDEAFLLACMEFIPAFIVGVIAEWFIVSKYAKKVSKYLHAKHFEKHNIIRINEFFIALGMVVVISVFGYLYHRNDTDTFFLVVLWYDFLKNAIFGIPLFMLVISPFARNRAAKITNRKYEKDILL